MVTDVIINLVVGIVWDVWRIRMLTIGTWLLLGRILDPEEDASVLDEASDDAEPLPDYIAGV